MITASLFWFRRNPFMTKTLKQTYEIEIKEVGKGLSIESNEKLPSESSGGLSSLAFKNNFHMESSGENGSSVQGNKSHGWQPEDWGYGGGDFRQVENFLPLIDIAREIDGLLNYPGALALREYTGGVRAQLYFRKEGGCDWKRSRIESSARYFRVYILALLKKLCALERVTKLRLSRGERVDLAFNFLLKDQQEFSPRPSFKVIGNVLLFERHEQKPPIELRLGPIRVYGPYIAVDFQWLFERWDQYVEGKDPLKEFQE